jgi:hypothetical protein
MALRSQKAACVIAILAPVLAAADVRLDVVHDHYYKGRPGVITIGEKVVAFEEAPKKGKPSEHRWTWSYDDIQQLELAPDRLRIVTYRDHRWKLGADREYEFRPAKGQGFEEAYGILKESLDQRFVAALARAPQDTLWEIPVKHLERFGGSHGVLKVGRNGVTFSTDAKRESRTWRYDDIANISSSGPFQLTVTTYERARLHYGSRKDLNFQLKQPLAEARYNQLWRRLNQAKGLPLLTSYEDLSQ